MKIKKEFIPLILSGEKRYEYRAEDVPKHEGFYSVHGKYYFLKLVKYCSYSRENIWEIFKQFLPDKLSYEFIIKNHKYFLNKIFCVYEWIPLEQKKELIEV